MIQPKKPLIKPKIKVAAYARVSRESERMQHSLSAQISYYNELIQKNPDWEFAGVFADIRVLLVIRVLILKPSKWFAFKPFLCLGQFNFSDSYANTALCLKIFGA